MKPSLKFLFLLSLSLTLSASRTRINAIAQTMADLDIGLQPGRLAPTPNDTPTPTSTPLVSTYIDEPILLDASEAVTARPVSRDEFILEFGGVSLVQNGMYNDFDLAYSTPSSCDEDLWAFNYSTGLWSQIGFSPPPGIMCLCVISGQSHLFSAVGLEAHQYLNENLEMNLRGHIIGAPIVRALQINPDYLAVPIMVQGVHGFDGLTYDGQSLWVSSNASNELYKVSLSGAILEELVAPSRYPFGLAFDGQNLWLADNTDRIFELTPDGDILCEFSVPTDYPGGLAWGDDKLWLTEYGGSQSLFGIEPDASCNTGVAVITDELQTPGGNSYGITWDGTHLLIASDKLYKVTTAGYLVEVYNLPVVSVKDIAWDGEAVWLLNHGPINVWGCDPVISRFRLRPCPPEPALRVSKQATPNPVQAGERLTYTIHITNTGNVDLHTTITDILPIQITPGNTSSGTLILPGGVLTWTPTITTPSGIWMEKVVVTAEMGYTGPLTNVVQVTTDEGATGTSTSIVTVAEELIVAEPGREETIVVTSTDGLTTTVEVPSDAVTESTQLAYTAVPTITGSPFGFGFAGHAFNLDAYRNGDQIAGFTFSVPITITLHYTETDVVGLNEDMLVLEYWHDSTGVWEDAACGPYDRHPDENWLAVPVSHLSRFALLGRTLNYVCLPIVWKIYNP